MGLLPLPLLLLSLIFLLLPFVCQPMQFEEHKETFFAKKRIVKRDADGGAETGSGNANGDSESRSATGGSGSGNGNQSGDMSIASFLNNITKESREELERILNNQNLTKNELNSEMDKWAERQGSTYNTVYKALKKAYEDARTELDKQHAEKMKSQPKEVQEADVKLYTILNNQFITRAEEDTQIKELSASFPDNVRGTLNILTPTLYRK